MPIIKRVPPECKCPNKPFPGDFGVGTIWECDNDECKQHWKVLEDKLLTFGFWDEFFAFLTRTKLTKKFWIRELTTGLTKSSQ